MTLEDLNKLPPKEALKELLACCGSRRWAKQMIEDRPFRDAEALQAAARKVWNNLSPKDWKEAFAHHPKIGDIKSLRNKFKAGAADSNWAEKEQSGVNRTSEKTLKALADGNKLYESKFGYIFIVCATGKSAGEMLQLLNARLNNYPADEIKIAAAEQEKITRLRMQKMLSENH